MLTKIKELRTKIQSELDKKNTDVQIESYIALAIREKQLTELITYIEERSK